MADKTAMWAGTVALVASLAAVYALSAAAPAAEPGLSGTVVIGHLVPLSGDAANDGANMMSAAQLAVSDFNARPGGTWTLELRTEDTRTDPDTARQKAAELRDSGIMISVGPATSADLGAVLGDDEADGMVLVSCCSSAPSLAVEDGAFRLTPDDTKEGLALAAFIMARGVDTVVPVWRGDLWGDGFKGSTEKELVSGGVTVEPGFRYEPGQGFEDIVPALAAAAAEAGPNAAIVMFGFDETAGLLDMASAHGGLDGLAWFGTGINTQDGHINDPVRLEFLERVQFTTINLKSGDNPAWQRLQEHLSLGEAPAFLAGAYDSVMLLGATIDEVQSADPSLVRAALPRVAETYSGALDHTRLNAAGDLDSADYTYWLAGGDGATLLGWYDGRSGTIEAP